MSTHGERTEAKILIIDDDQSVCKMLSHTAKCLGYHAAYECTLDKGFRRVTSDLYDIVFLDVKMPDGNGLDFLPHIRMAQSSPEVIVMTGYGSHDGAEIAIKRGAWNYLQKPLTPGNVLVPLKSILAHRNSVKQAAKEPVVPILDGIVGSSTATKACINLIPKAASSEANVLITGETGTGKELFARAIHNNSSRRDASCVVVDCAGLPQTLIESVLFGHERGAFTGAETAQKGLVAQAHTGTLFLDEVGELPLPIQKTFLRVLQERRFRPVGGKKEYESDFRLVAATNRDLWEMTAKGIFRNDLLYRLNVIEIRLPPLRERLEDIRELVLYHINRFCKKYGKITKAVSPDSFDILAQYDWPGNVRELVNVLERALAISGQDPTLLPKHLPAEVRVKAAQALLRDEASLSLNLAESGGTSFSLPNFKEYKKKLLSEAEKKYLSELLLFTKGSIKDACEISGLGRTWLYSQMKKYRINRFACHSS